MIKSAAIDHYIDSFAHVHYRDVNNRTGYNLQSYKLIDEFFECITSNIKPARNGVYTIWLRAERSTLKEFASYHVPDEEEIDDDIIQWWKDKYPNETVVYELTAIYDRETDYKAIDLNNTFVVEYDKRKECDFCYDIQDLMEWIIKETRHSVLDLMVGTYQSEFEKIIPKRLRTGTIVRKDYWDIFPDRRDKFYSDLSQDEKDEFISFASAQPDRTHKYTQRIPNMTANLFFEACSLGYAANNYDIEGLSPLRQYKKFADGRDEGLMEIDADSPLEFCKWYASEDRRGGHPWEVMRGGNSTHVQLTVRLDSKGFWFTLSGKSMVRSIETIKFYNALCRNDKPTQ